MADPESIFARLSHRHRKEQLLLEAAWRYQVMSPLLQPGLTPQQRCEVRKRILEVPHPHPWRGEVKVSGRTLRRWVQQYAQNRLEGLTYQGRKDRKTSRKLPQGALELAQSIFADDNRLGPTQLLRHLLSARPEWKGKISRSTLDRHLRALGVIRLARPTPAYRSFEAIEPGDIWQGDIVHGPQILVGEKQVTAKIVTWIDDHSRFVLHIQAYENERMPAIEDSLVQAILKYGKPLVVYVDNGKVYCSHAMTMACSELGIRKRHTQPNRPEGKGKQERFYRTLRGQLLNEVEGIEPIPIERLNGLLACWLSLYHATEHSKTKETPAERFKRGTIRPADRVVLEEAFLQWTERKVSKQGIVDFGGQQYYVDIGLAGHHVIVHYNPFDISKINLWREGKKWSSHP